MKQMPPDSFKRLVNKRMQGTSPPPGNFVPGVGEVGRKEQAIRNQRNPRMPYGAKPDYYTRDRYGRKIPHFSSGQPGSPGNYSNRGRA